MPRMSANAPTSATDPPQRATVVDETTNPALALQAALARCVVAGAHLQITGELPAYVTNREEDPPCPTQPR